MTTAIPPAGGLLSLTGSMVAIATPFSEEAGESINFNALSDLVDHQIQGGTSAIIPSGTTGESPTLNDVEFQELVSLIVDKTRGSNTKVIAGTGSNSTKAAVRKTEQAATLGADACLIVTPYYNKPPVEGIIAHFQELDKVGIPLVIYNVPGRTGLNLAPETIVKIAQTCSNVVAVKASNGDLDQITELAAHARSLPTPLTILSGDDSLTLPILAVGGRGVVSVAANVMPKVMSTLVAKTLSGDLNTARTIMLDIHEFCIALLKVAANPIPIKAVLRAAGIRVGPCRLPLVDLSPAATRALVATAIAMRERLRAHGVVYDGVLDRLK